MPQLVNISEFDGGITDNYLNCRPNQYKEADNLFVSQEKGLDTRTGTSIYDDIIYQLPIGNYRLNHLERFDDILFCFGSSGVFYPESDLSSWNTLLGPTSSPAQYGASSSTRFSSAIWKDHLIVTNDDLTIPPAKIYKDEDSGDYRIRTCGLPSVRLVTACQLANEIKDKFNWHLAQTVTVHKVADTTNVVTSPNAYDLPSLITLVSELLTDYAAHDLDARTSTLVYHIAQDSIFLDSVAAPKTLTECITRLTNLKSKYNEHQNSTNAHYTAPSESEISGVPEPTATSSGGSGQNFVYAIVPYYTYKANGVTYEDFGPSFEISLSNIGAPSSNTVTISNIGILDNHGITSYDIVNVDWYIYRTTNGGTTFYFEKSIDNGTTSTTSTTADSTIDDNTVLYLTGGVLDNDPPPRAKYVVQVNDITWYAHVQEADGVERSRIRQSVKFDPDSCPEELYIDVDDEITGMSYKDIYPIVFCKSRIYRLEGSKDESGVGIIQKREISRTVGCISDNSIINTPDGIYFAGENGFYFTDGYKVFRVSGEFDTRYKKLVSTSALRSRVYAEYDPTENRVFWAVSSDSGESENNKLFVLDLTYGLRNISGVVDALEGTFTTITPYNSWKPTALAIDSNGDIVIGDSRGYLFKFDDDKSTDPKVDIDTTPSNWNTSTILFEYEGPGIHLNEKALLKIAQSLSVVCKNKGNLSIEASLSYDDEGGYTALGVIRFQGQLLWKVPGQITWKQTSPESDPLWKRFPLTSAKRKSVRNPTRFLMVQVRFKNAVTNIQNSDDFGEASINGTTKVLTLSGGNQFVTDTSDYFIAVEADSYATLYPVVTVTPPVAASTITVMDPLSTLSTDASSKWLLKGARKGEKINLLNYTIEIEPASNALPPYRGEDGGNA